MSIVCDIIIFFLEIYIKELQLVLDILILVGNEFHYCIYIVLMDSSLFHVF